MQGNQPHNLPLILRCYTSFHCLSVSQGRWHKSSLRTKQVAGLQQGNVSHVSWPWEHHQSSLSQPILGPQFSPPGPSVPAPEVPQQGWSPSPHSPALPSCRSPEPDPHMGLFPDPSASPRPSLATLGLCLTPVRSLQVNGLSPRILQYHPVPVLLWAASRVPTLEASAVLLPHYTRDVNMS